MKKNYIILILLIVFSSVRVFAQSDTLVMKDGTVLTGDVKDMDKGVLVMETSFSDDDFKIEWKNVKKLTSNEPYLVLLTDGKRITGILEPLAGRKVTIKPALGDKSSPVTVSLDDIVFIKSVDSKVWDRFSFDFSIGFDLARAKNMRQITSRNSIGYLAPKWSTDATFNSLFSKQDSVDNIKRYDGGLNYKLFLGKSWYVPASVNFLSNTDQDLKLRTVGKLGFGRYIIRTNKEYWGLELGAAYNNENYFSNIDPRNSTEAYLGTEFNMFDYSDISLLLKSSVFADLVHKNHWRSDISFDLNYDLPLDFYIAFGFSLNWDNKPGSPGAAQTDYVLHTGFGWSP